MKELLCNAYAYTVVPSTTGCALDPVNYFFFKKRQPTLLQLIHNAHIRDYLMESCVILDSELTPCCYRVIQQISIKWSGINLLEPGINGAMWLNIALVGLNRSHIIAKGAFVPELLLHGHGRTLLFMLSAWISPTCRMGRQRTPDRNSTCRGPEFVSRVHAIIIPNSFTQLQKHLNKHQALQSL